MSSQTRVRLQTSLLIDMRMNVKLFCAKYVRKRDIKIAFEWCNVDSAVSESSLSEVLSYQFPEIDLIDMEIGMIFLLNFPHHFLCSFQTSKRKCSSSMAHIISFMNKDRVYAMKTTHSKEPYLSFRSSVSFNF